MQNKYSRRVRCARLWCLLRVCVSLLLLWVDSVLIFPLDGMNNADSNLSFCRTFTTVTNTLPLNYLYIYQAIVNSILFYSWPHCSTGKQDVPMIFQKINERISVSLKKLYNSAIVNICHSSQKHKFSKSCLPNRAFLVLVFAAQFVVHQTVFPKRNKCLAVAIPCC